MSGCTGDSDLPSVAPPPPADPAPVKAEEKGQVAPKSRIVPGSSSSSLKATSH
jgi:hypothetical protein